MLGASPAPAAIGANMQQFQKPQNKVIGIEPPWKNDCVDMLEPAGVAAE
jgi:hypothetical protein